MKTYKLNFELVPDACWYANLRSVLTAEQWDVIRKDAYARAKGKCMICGAAGRLEAHERWSYDDENLVQTLQTVIAVCRSCHEVIHIGRTQLMGRGMEAMEHFMKVNQCRQMDYHAALANANEEYFRRNRVEGWVTDITWLENKYNIQLR